MDFRKCGAKVFDSGVFLAYVTVIALLLMHHEPWRDEAQTWLVVRDHGFFELWSYLHFEGHPVGWYLILFPFVKLGFPFITQSILHYAFNGAFACLFYRYAPFPRLARAAVIFGYFFIYEYNAMARNYVFIPLLLTIIAMRYRHRFDSVRNGALYGGLLALLANFHFFAALVTCSLVAADLLEAARRRWRDIPNIRSRMVATGIAGSGVLLTAVTLSGDKLSFPYTIDAQFFLALLQKMFFCLANLLLCGQLDPVANNPYTGTILGLGVGLVVVGLLYPARNALVVTALTLLSLSLYFTIGIYTGVRHIGVLYAAVVFACWIAREQEPVLLHGWRRKGRGWAEQLAVGFLFFHVMVGMGNVYNDVIREYSGAKTTAAFLKEYGYDRDDVIVVGFRPNLVSGILPFLDSMKTFVYPHYTDTGSYIQYSDSIKLNNKRPHEEAFAYADRYAVSGSELLVILDKKVAPPPGWSLIYTQDPKAVIRGDEEAFSVYLRESI